MQNSQELIDTYKKTYQDFIEGPIDVVSRLVDAVEILRNANNWPAESNFTSVKGVDNNIRYTLVDLKRACQKLVSLYSPFTFDTSNVEYGADQLFDLLQRTSSDPSSAGGLLSEKPASANSTRLGRY